MTQRKFKRRLNAHGVSRTGRLSLMAALAAGVVTEGSASAASAWNAFSSNWNNASNWSPVGVPGAGATVNIANTDGVARVITYDYTGAAVTLSSLIVDLTGNAANADTLSMAGNNLAATNEYVGDSGAGSGGNGVFNQSGGTNTCNALYFAFNATDTGTYYLSGSATLNATGSEDVGYLGSATINQSGASYNITGTELIGFGVAGTTGTYVQSGGTNSATNFYLDDYQGAGVYNLSGGALNSTNRAYIGAAGTGASFIQTSGTFSALGGITIGQAAPTTFNLGGGTLSVTGSEIIGTAASLTTFLQTFGTHSVSGDLGLGQGAALSVYNMSGNAFNSGTLTVGGNFNVGNGGNATLLVIAAENAITVTGSFNVATTPTSTGRVTLIGSGGPCNLSAGSINIGGTVNSAGGSATVTVGTGGVLVTGGALTLYNNSNVALNLSGGTIDAGSILFNGSSARFNWTSGTFNVSTGGIAVDTSTAAFSVGPTLSVSAGKSLISAGGELIGYAGNGSFSQTGGTNQTGELLVGGATTNASGAYILSGGSLNVTNALTGEAIVGYSGPGQFNQTGGNFTADLLAVAILPGISGIVNISGSSSAVINDELDLGFTGPAVLNQSGGKVVVGSSTVQGNVSIGCSVGSVATYNLSAGSLTVNGNVDVGGYLAGDTGLIPGSGGTGVLLIGPGTTSAITGTLLIYNTTGTSVNLNGGTLSVGVLDTMGTPSNFNWSTGTVTLSNTNLAFDSLASTATAPFGSNFSLNAGQTLVVSQSESVGGLGLGSLTLNTGSTHTVVGNLSVNTGGTLNLSGGTLQTGSLNLSGGTINGTLVNQSLFTYISGSFSGKLVNQGAVNFQANFTASGGIENDSTFVVPIGRTVTTGATGFDNLGTVYLNGGSLAGGAVVNDYGGQLYGYGTIQPALTNDGNMNVTGVLTLNSAAANYGNISVPTGGVIRGSAITNNAGITLSGGAITSSITNPAGGTIAGSGSITGGLTNNGTIQPGPGTLSITGWTNAGLVTLASANSTLAGGAITNTSTIEGFGLISATVLNTSGIIRAQNGELDLTGTNSTNGQSAQIQVMANASLVYTQGLGTNNGTIEVSGGAFHNGTTLISNFGLIEGTGTFDAATWLNFSGAQMNLTANSNIYGNVVNSGAIHLYGTNITFFGNLTNNGTLKVTAGSVYYLGSNGANVGGSYASDPSDNYFNGLTISSTGSVTGGTGDRFFIINGMPLINAGTFSDLGTLSANAVITSGTFLQTGTLVETGNFNNSGTATIGGIQNWSSGTLFSNTAGTATFQSDAGVAAENLSVNASGGTVTFASTQHLAGLHISSGGLVTVAGTGNGHRSVVFTPAFSNGGTLDLTGNDLDYQSGGSAGLASAMVFLKQGFNNGSWTGAGITSSKAADDTTHLTAVGVILNNIGNGAPFYTSFDGASVAVNDVLFKYTYFGDANLDGKVDGSDYSRIDNGALLGLTGWVNGDFNYDGVVNGSDYTLIDNTFNRQGAQLDAAVATGEISSAGAAVIPEPTSAMVLGTALLGLSRRKGKVAAQSMA